MTDPSETPATSDTPEKSERPGSPEVSEAAETLTLQREFARLSVDELFAHFVEPALLTRWWPEAAEVEPRNGGAYSLSWPKMKWTLRGMYSRFDVGQALEFTWAWDHEPDLPTRVVVLEFGEHADGAQLTMTQRTYGPDDKEQADRVSHRQGWNYFLDKLAGLGENDGSSADTGDEPAAGRDEVAGDE